MMKEKTKEIIYENYDLETLIKWFEKRIYPVKVRHKDIYSEETIRLRGIPSVGSKQEDTALMNEKVLTYCKIPEMIERQNNGIPLYFEKPSDAKEVYQLTNAMLGKIIEEVRYRGSFGRFNHEAVSRLDLFLKQIFPIAAGAIPRHAPSMTMFNSLSLSTTPKQEPVALLREHKPHVDENDAFLLEKRMQAVGLAKTSSSPQDDDYRPFNFL